MYIRIKEIRYLLNYLHKCYGKWKVGGAASKLTFLLLSFDIRLCLIESSVIFMLNNVIFPFFHVPISWNHPTTVQSFKQIQIQYYPAQLFNYQSWSHVLRISRLLSFVLLLITSCYLFVKWKLSQFADVERNCFYVDWWWAFSCVSVQFKQLANSLGCWNKKEAATHNRQPNQIQRKKWKTIYH